LIPQGLSLKALIIKFMAIKSTIVFLNIVQVVYANR